MTLEEVRAEILRDYELVNVSRQASLLGRKEVLTGKAKFGIFGDGKELAQVALAKQFRHGDWRSGYYRDMTFMFAIGELTVQQWFAQLYAHADLDQEPASAGRQMNGHFATRSLDEHGEWKDLTAQYNSSPDISPTAGQMPRLLGLAQASKHFRQDKALHAYTHLSDRGNEVAFGTALVSAEATLDGANLPTGVVPLTFSTNASSLGATAQGGANGINAAAAWYPELAVTSITVEFWARTVESVATPFRMSSGGLDGIVVTDPNSLDVTWHVDVGGTPTRFSFSGVDDMDAAWSHYAFVYDEVFGVATFYVDGLVVATFDGPDGAPLVLLPGTAVEVGVLMDYASAGQGTIDELRISNAALGPSGFLVPEPSTGALVALGTAVLAMRRGSRPRRAGAPPRR